MILTGCTDTGADGADNGGATTSVPTPETSSAPADSPLRPVMPDTLTGDTAETEATRLADSIQAMINPSDILFVDDHAQLVEETESGSPYYGILRTINLDASVDPVDLARDIVGQLTFADWEQREETDTEGSFFVAMTSGDSTDATWVVLLGGDSTVEDQSVITLQLASPDLP